MNKLPLYGAVFAVLTLAGSTIYTGSQAVAADLNTYEGHDRSYIDRTLDEFERRTGQYSTRQYKHYDDETYKTQYNKYGYKKHVTDDGDYDDRPKHKFDKYDDEGSWREGCLPIRKIHRSLIKRGWHDFHSLNEGPRRVRMLATNYNGRRFKLVVDKCSGEIIRRRPMRKYWAWDR